MVLEDLRAMQRPLSRDRRRRPCARVRRARGTAAARHRRDADGRRWRWRGALRSESMPPCGSTLHIVADMAAQTYERVDLADERVREGELNRRLADVGERLATAGIDRGGRRHAGGFRRRMRGCAVGGAVGVLDRGPRHPAHGRRGARGGVDRLPRRTCLRTRRRGPSTRAGVRCPRACPMVRCRRARGGRVVAEPLLDHRRQPGRRDHRDVPARRGRGPQDAAGR